MVNENIEDECINSVNWHEKEVRIPKDSYDAGGVSLKYTNEKVIEVLDFFYKNILKENLIEAISEEQEDSHHSELFDIAAIKAIQDKPEIAKSVLSYVRHPEKRKKAYQAYIGGPGIIRKPKK